MNHTLHCIDDGRLVIFGPYNADTTAKSFAKSIRLLDSHVPVTTFSVTPKPGYEWVWTVGGTRVRKVW